MPWASSLAFNTSRLGCYEKLLLLCARDGALFRCGGCVKAYYGFKFLDICVSFVLNVTVEPTTELRCVLL